MTFDIIIQIALLGLGLSADAFSVALVDGLTYQDINKKKIFFIAAPFGVMQALMPLVGFWIVELVEHIAGGVAGSEAGSIASLIVAIICLVILKK